MSKKNVARAVLVIFALCCIGAFAAGVALSERQNFWIPGLALTLLAVAPVLGMRYQIHKMRPNPSSEQMTVNVGSEGLTGDICLVFLCQFAGWCYVLIPAVVAVVAFIAVIAVLIRGSAYLINRLTGDDQAPPQPTSSGENT